MFYKAVEIDSINYTAYFNLCSLYPEKKEIKDLALFVNKYNSLFLQNRKTYSEEMRNTILDFRRTVAFTFYKDRTVEDYFTNLLNLMYEFALNGMKDSVKYYLPVIKYLPEYFYSDEFYLPYVYQIGILYHALGDYKKRDSVLSEILSFSNSFFSVNMVFIRFGGEMPVVVMDKFLNHFSKRVEREKDNEEAIGRLTIALSTVIYPVVKWSIKEAEKIFRFMHRTSEITGIKGIKAEACYHWACIKARNNQIDSAIFYLEKFAEHGYVDKNYILSDPDLVEVRKDKRFEKIKRMIEQNINKKVIKEIENTKKEIKPLENFKIVTLDGDTTDIYSFPKRPLLIKFWGTGCGWCEKAVEDILKIKRNHPELTVVFINAWGNSAEEIKRYLKIRECSQFSNFILPKEEIKKVFAGSVGVPRFMLIDGKNRVIWSSRGYSPYMVKLIEELLK